MVLVEYKSDKKYARYRPYSYGSIESALPDIKRRLKSQKTVACRINGREIFGVFDNRIIYKDTMRS